MPEPKQALVHFSMNGSYYSFTMPAESFEDAEKRLEAIRLTAIVKGWPCYSYSANSLTLPFVGVWVVITTFFRNLFKMKE